MTPVLSRINRTTDVVVTAAAYVAGGILVLLMLLTTADVAGRYFLNAPIIGVFDLTHFAVLSMTFLGLAYCGFQDGHVTIELLYDHLHKTVQHVLDRVTNLVGCALFIIIAWQAIIQSETVRLLNESSQLMQIPLYPLYWLLAFGSALFALVMGLKALFPAIGSKERS